MGKIAFLFAGQGAQYAGMGQSIYEFVPQAKKALDEMESLFPGLLDICFQDSQKQLNTTLFTQPCVFAIDYACAVALQSANISPHAVAGFSLGELPAVAFSGMLSLEQAFMAVLQRAKCMQAAAQETPGCMCAVLRLDASVAEELASQFLGVYPVNYNCPQQTVVAASVDVMPKFESAVAAKGGRCVRLAVSGAFHSPYMVNAAQAFEYYITGIPFSLPKMPVYANKTAETYGEAPARLLSAQIANPVLWQKTLENMHAAGIDTFIEVGPGKTLTGLVKKTLPHVNVSNVENFADIEKVLTFCKEHGNG